MTEIETNAGTFKGLVYEAHPGLGGERDMLAIKLEFHPNQGVDAELFAMVQMACTIKDGGLFLPDPKVRPKEAKEAKKLRDAGINPEPSQEEKVQAIKDRSIPAGEGAGNHIDNLASSASPLYGAVNVPGPLELGETHLSAAKMDEQTGLYGSDVSQFGWHYKNSGGTQLSQHARLNDYPSLRNAGPNSSQKFETTVLATKGKQVGTYYGSVTWGWEKDSAGKLQKLPLTLKSAGAPSELFRQAAEVWNAAKSSRGDANIPLPLPAQSSPSRLSDAATGAPAGALDEN